MRQRTLPSPTLAHTFAYTFAYTVAHIGTLAARCKQDYYLVQHGWRWRAVPLIVDGGCEAVRRAGTDNEGAKYSICMYLTSSFLLRRLAFLHSDGPKANGCDSPCALASCPSFLFALCPNRFGPCVLRQALCGSYGTCFKKLGCAAQTPFSMVFSGNTLRRTLHKTHLFVHTHSTRHTCVHNTRLLHPHNINLAAHSIEC